MKLSPHFTLEEMTFSETAVRHGWHNQPPTEYYENLKRLCEYVLEPIREAFGAIRITSGYRSPEVNAAVGSKPSSAHIEGRAADIQVATMRPLVLARAIDELDLPCDQIIHEFGRWVHLAIAKLGSAPRKELLTIDQSGARLGLVEIL